MAAANSSAGVLAGMASVQCLHRLHHCQVVSLAIEASLLEPCNPALQPKQHILKAAYPQTKATGSMLQPSFPCHQIFQLSPSRNLNEPVPGGRQQQTFTAWQGALLILRRHQKSMQIRKFLSAASTASGHAYAQHVLVSTKQLWHGCTMSMPDLLPASAGSLPQNQMRKYCRSCKVHMKVC